MNASSGGKSKVNWGTVGYGTGEIAFGVYGTWVSGGMGAPITVPLITFGISNVILGFNGYPTVDDMFVEQAKRVPDGPMNQVRDAIFMYGSPPPIPYIPQNNQAPKKEKKK